MGPKIKSGGADLPRRSIPENFLFANAYKCAKF